LQLPLLRKNGFIVVDDISSQAVRPACAVLKRKLQFIYKRPLHKDEDRASDYAVFWKNSSWLGGNVPRVMLPYVTESDRPRS
jgi:hypothetical protein